MGQVVTRRQLEAAYCWEADDQVPGRPAMTEFRQRLRYQQARWREAQGHPIGSQPIVPRPGADARPVGSRLPLAYAQESGAVDLEAREAARIVVLTLGVAGTLSGGEGGIGLDGAGSASVNTIANTTEASIRNNSTVTSGDGYGVTVHASDASTIAAAASCSRERH